ncbi:MAG TPA: hypothetical protein EYP11_05820 [Aquificaceae bacterium]|nr:hypothetical protein [Aquificaceae bacterium]
MSVGVLFLALFLTSCAQVLLPYHEEPLCKKESRVGYCGSLSEIYEDMEANPWKYGLEER